MRGSFSPDFESKGLLDTAAAREWDLLDLPECDTYCNNDKHIGLMLSSLPRIRSHALVSIFMTVL